MIDGQGKSWTLEGNLRNVIGIHNEASPENIFECP